MEYKGEGVKIDKMEWVPAEQCPCVDTYVIRILERLEGVTSSGKRVNLLEKRLQSVE